MGPTGFRTVTIQTLLDPKNAPNIKQYLDYDGDGNVTDIYWVQAAASGGENCLRQRLEYGTVSGTQVVRKIDWVTATWSGTSWDITS